MRRGARRAREVAARFPDKRRTKIGGAGGEDVEFVAEDFIVDEEATVDRHPRRLDQARARGEGSVGHAPARGRRGAGGARAARPRSRWRSSRNLGTRLRRCASTTCRRRPATASRCRSCSSSATASAWSARCRSTRGRRAQGGAGGGGQQARLRPALRARAAPRAVDPRRPPVRQAGRGRRDRRRRARVEHDDVVCVVTSDARALVCKADELPELANPGRGVTVIKVGDDDRWSASASARAQGQGRHHRRDRRRQGAARRPRPLTRSPSRGGKGHALQAQDEDRARDAGRAARAAAAADAAELTMDHGQRPRTRPNTSRSSRASSRCAAAPACTSAAPTARATTTCCGRSSTTPSTR